MARAGIKGESGGWTRERATAVAISVVLLALCAQERGFALDFGNPKYWLQKRSGPDREEGIKPLERSGAYIDLVGVFLNVPGMKDGPAAESFRLGFYLPKREHRVRIRVRDYDRFGAANYHYWMVPAQTTFDRGFQQFAWDATLARELGIGLQHLGARAEIDGYEFPVVAPLLLGTGHFPRRLKAQGVRFVFVPNETMDVAYSVYPKSAPTQPLVQASAAKWLKSQQRTASWSGIDRAGKPVEEGWYILAVTATFITPQGFKETIPLDHTFHYRPELAIEP